MGGWGGGGGCGGGGGGWGGGGGVGGWGGVGGLHQVGISPTAEPNTQLRVPNTQHTVPNTQQVMPNTQHFVPNTQFSKPYTQISKPNTSNSKPKLSTVWSIFSPTSEGLGIDLGARNRSVCIVSRLVCPLLEGAHAGFALNRAQTPLPLTPLCPLLAS